MITLHRSPAFWCCQEACVRTSHPCATPLVQVRQHREHKRTFMYLEQLILRYNAAGSCLAIKEIHEASDGPPVHGFASQSMLWGAALPSRNLMMQAPVMSPAACVLRQMSNRRHTAYRCDRLLLHLSPAGQQVLAKLCSSWVWPPAVLQLA